MLASRIVPAVLLTAVAFSALASPAEPREVRLEVTDAGEFFLAGKLVPPRDLRARLHELKSGGERIDLHISARGDVQYEYLMQAWQIAGEEGLAKVGVITGVPSAPNTSVLPATK